jgi:hypothetical protein
MNSNDEEALGLLNRLLEGLHQAGFENFGSHINLVYVAPGAQYVNHIDTQVFGERKPQNAVQDTPVKDTPPPLPPELSTDKAMALWQKAQRAGFVDADYQPLLSRTQSALLADAMAERLGIKEKWKVFEALWNRKNMRSDYNLALTRKLSLDFQDELKRVFV